MQKSAVIAALAICTIFFASYMFAEQSNNGVQFYSTKSLNEKYALFAAWKDQFDIEYEDATEEAFRFGVFTVNLETIDAHNARPESTFTMGLTQFSDLTQDEFAQKYLTYNHEDKQSRPRNYKTLPEDNLPTTWNWTEKGAVTPVKNQGQCGSCWAFSTTGSLEGLHFLKTGILMSFSEQQLMDCTYTYGNKACKGGIMDRAFEYVENKGIELEGDYPYTGNTSIICHYNQRQVKFKNTGFYDVPASVQQLAAAVVQQPVSVAVEANQASWQFYTGGVITNDCGTKLDHGVLVTGFGVDKHNYDAWYVKNSWGAFWGENGYVRIEKKDGKDLCGIYLSASYPTV